MSQITLKWHLNNTVTAVNWILHGNEISDIQRPLGHDWFVISHHGVFNNDTSMTFHKSHGVNYQQPRLGGTQKP